MAADLPNELIELLERIVLHGVCVCVCVCVTSRVRAAHCVCTPFGVPL